VRSSESLSQLLTLKPIKHGIPEHTNMNVKSEQSRLVIVVNSAIALGFLQGQLQYLEQKGFNVTVLCPGRRKDEWEVSHPESVPIIEVPMDREIVPLRDLISLWRLWRIMRTLRPVVTNVGTPKAGLLGGFAAWLAGVPCRFYTLHGLRFETAQGLKRRLLVLAERLSCRLAHRVICVSQSVRERAIAFGLASRERTVIFGAGSCNGVDALRFRVTPERMRQSAALRCQLGIPSQAPVVAFVGRLTRDKGIPELVQAFLSLDRQFPNLRLLLVGCFESEDPLPVETRKCLETHPRVILAGPAQDVAPYYAIADVVALPSHREGLPTVILEAQAAGKPVIGAAATGIVDVVADGQTGLLFPVGDVSALAEGLARLISDKPLAHGLGRAGQEQIKRTFRQEQVWEALCQEYLSFLRMRNLPLPSRPLAGDNPSAAAPDRMGAPSMSR
jgi:glycosyltransferase involved in cell wall biosynthesis